MKIVFPLWKNAIISKFHWNSFLEVELTKDYLCLFGSGNGLASNSLKAIIWANDGLFYVDAYMCYSAFMSWCNNLMQQTVAISEL